MLERIHLQILDSLHRNTSLTRAAEEMNLTQSALTHRIKKLESLFGVTIWEKEGKILRLTQAGEHLRRSAAGIEARFTELETSLRAYAGGKKGCLRIGIECHPCYDVLLELIHGFLYKWEGVDIDVTRDFQFTGYRALRDHQVDAIITPDYLEYEDLEYHVVRDFELLLAVGPGHRLAGKKDVEPADLQGETLFTYPISVERLDVFLNFLLPAGIHPVAHEIVEDTEIMLQLVSAGRGVSTFPDWIIEKHYSKYPVRGISLGKAGIQKSLYVVVRKDMHRPAFLQDFIHLSY